MDWSESERLCHRGGQERALERQELVQTLGRLPLMEKKAAPPGLQVTPEVVVVEPDGGRLQKRLWDLAETANIEACRVSHRSP
ncbi:MAG: hypothetical protein NT069_00975 [Planctomycetota bacterium]|nr:hypothetical protein [Planctomycetota bacterium]